MTDGLYQVTNNYLCAGFYVESGKLVMCAPVLKRNFWHWYWSAVRVVG